MTITTKFYEVNKGCVKANCSICIDGKLVINGFRVMTTKDKKRTFVSFPQTMGSNGGYYSTVYCMDKEYYNALSDKILKDYNVSRETPQETNMDLPL